MEDPMRSHPARGGPILTASELARIAFIVRAESLIRLSMRMQKCMDWLAELDELRALHAAGEASEGELRDVEDVALGLLDAELAAVSEVSYEDP